jgi:plastocyanin
MKEWNRFNDPVASGVSRRTFLRLVCAGCGALSVSLLAACVHRSTHSRTVNITTDGHFEPGSITIPIGELVVWNNQTTLPHTATCDPSKARNPSDVALPQGASSWDSGPIQPGATWAHTFNTAGTFIYFSNNEEDANMLGTIVVKG